MNHGDTKLFSSDVTKLKKTWAGWGNGANTPVLGGRSKPNSSSSKIAVVGVAVARGFIFSPPNQPVFVRAMRRVAENYQQAFLWLNTVKRRKQGSLVREKKMKN
ncbi:hypothetical protein RRG08_044855 [Elysia crispata]|uniref:Uncharacterized protein n=1 Tax=Elysia crispata TaxID=231223 RepID=A0AAE1DSF9_9GAST|nr:hypothetical protein RRG08_044855 [Elysia crispata]